MKFELYRKGSVTPEYMEFEDRFECAHYVFDNRELLQKFSTKTSGLIMGYAAEIDDTKNNRFEEVALLYPHRIAGDIWIECV